MGGYAEQLLVALAKRKRAQMRRRIAGAGAILTVFVATLVWHSSMPKGSTASGMATMHRNKAIVTEPLRRTLPDGSTVELKPGAEIVTQSFADLAGRRRVTLKTGEAHFQVAQDPIRPFLVEAGGVVFRAVGTAFAVDVARQSIEMIVTEGTVAVDRSDPSPPAPPAGKPSNSEMLALVGAGNRVRLDMEHPAIAPAVEPLSVAEANEKLSWRVPRLEFNETPLSEVVSLINQHTRSRISVADAELGRLEISGSIRANNIAPLLHMLEANYRINLIRQPSGVIELNR